MVLIGHVIAEAGHYLAIDMPLNDLPWTRGVDIFFVISGFIILLSGQRWFGCPGGAAAFLARRFRRVVPLYWLFTTLMLAVLVLAPGAAKDTVLNWQQVSASYLFIPFERYDGRVAPILSLGWTLNYEIFFYTVFAAALFMPRRIGPLAVVTGLALWVALGAAAGFSATLTRVWSNPIVLEFCFGVLLGLVWLRSAARIAPNPTLAVLLCLAGLVLMTALWTVEDLPRWLAAGLPAALMVGAMAFLWPAAPPGSVAGRFAGLMGDSSYALYLSHRFVLRALTLLLVPVLPQTQTMAWIYVACACAAALAFAVLVHRRFENPFLMHRPARFRWA